MRLLPRRRHLKYAFIVGTIACVAAWALTWRHSAHLTWWELSVSLYRGDCRLQYIRTIDFILNAPWGGPLAPPQSPGWMPSLSKTLYGWQLLLPLWIPITLFVLGTALTWRSRKPLPGHCPACGYNRAGLTGVCPECGAA